MNPTPGACSRCKYEEEEFFSKLKFEQNEKQEAAEELRNRQNQRLFNLKTRFFLCLYVSEPRSVSSKMWVTVILC